MSRFLRTTSFAGFLMFLSAANVFGGELTFPNNTLCDAKFSGSITGADLSKFEVLMERTGYQPITLCLDSAEGGDLAVGMEVLQMIWRANVDTLVLPGDTCFSTCALIFIAGGNTQGTDVTRQVQRDMFAGARVGFHGPGLNLPKGRLQPTELVVEAHNTAIRVAGELFGINQIRERDVVVLTDFLLSTILQTPSNEAYWIDTVGDAILSDIQVLGIQYTAATRANVVQTARNVCANTLAKSPPRESTFRMTRNSFQHYRLTTISDLDLERPLETDDPTDWFNPEMSVTVDKRDGVFRGVAGPFWSGSKYYQTWCVFELPSLEVVPEDQTFLDVRAGSFDTYEDLTVDWPNLVPEEAWEALQSVSSLYALHPSLRIDELPRITTPELRVAQRLSVFKAMQSSSRNSKNVLLLKGFDVYSENPDLLSLRDAEVEQCLAKCQDFEDQCTTFTYDRWNRACYLKSNVYSAITRNSKADTYVLGTVGNHSFVADSPLIKYVLKGKTFNLSGSFRELSTDNAFECLSVCERDELCDAIEYRDSQCHLLSAPLEYFDGDADSQVGFFEQEQPY